MWKSFKQRLLGYKAWSYSIIFLYKCLIRTILWTCRVDVSGLEELVKAASEEPTILMLWHNQLLILPEILYRYAPQFIYCAFISKSRDGDLLATLANSYQAGRVLRVPHNMRHQALSQLVKQLQSNEEVMVITPDGPRGPTYKMKPGVVFAAQATKAKIVPFSWSSDRMWRLRTWDKMQVPKPFSRISIRFGRAMSVPEEGEIEENREYLEEKLNLN